MTKSIIHRVTAEELAKEIVRADSRDIPWEHVPLGLKEMATTWAKRSLDALKRIEERESGDEMGQG